MAQYQLFDAPAFAAAKARMQAAGRQVWGYHCVSPISPTDLNTFLDVPLAKARLLPWYSAARGLDGWLYWYTNWGARHAPSAVDAHGRYVPLPALPPNGTARYDPRVGKPSELSRGDFSNEDGNLVYSGTAGPLSSLRLEALRLGFEDRALLALLGRAAAAELARTVVEAATNFSLSASDLEDARMSAATRIGRSACSGAVA